MEQCWVSLGTAEGYSMLVNSNSEPEEISPQVTWPEIEFLEIAHISLRFQVSYLC